MFAGHDGHTRPPRAGDVVRVKDFDQIRATLDERGTCEGLPFMPEMIRYCGRTFRVGRRVEHVFIDHLNYVARLENTVILHELRCDGARHGGCQMGCQLLWKDAWLCPADRLEEAASEEAQSAEAGNSLAADPDASRFAATAAIDLPTEHKGKLWCQATQLPLITKPLPWWDLRQYVRGLRARNLSLPELLRMAALLVANKVRWWRGREPLGMLSGPRKRTAHESLHLVPGEWVEVKSREEIRATLDAHGKHRGMAFVPEMALYCGRRFRVARRVEKMIQEGTGELRQLKDTVALETVTCQGLAQRRCPRGCFHLWRESWLRRVPAPSPVDVAQPQPASLDRASWDAAARPEAVPAEAAEKAAAKPPAAEAAPSEPRKFAPLPILDAAGMSPTEETAPA